MKKINIAIIIALIMTNYHLFSTNWDFIKGPANNKRITALEIDNDTIYIALSEKLFKTTNLGKSWEEIKYNDSSSFRNISTIIHQNSTFFLQSPFRTSEPHYEGTISTNNGKDWLNVFPNVKIIKYNFLIEDENKIFCSLNISNKSKSSIGVYEYNINSHKWEIFFDSLISSQFKKMPKTICNRNGNYFFGTEISEFFIDLGYKTPNIYIYNPNENSMTSILDTLSDIWKSYINCFLVNGDDIFAGTSSGVYKSEDGGYTWTKKNDGLHFVQGEYEYDYQVYKMMQYEDIFYGIATPPSAYGQFFSEKAYLVYSTDFGESWKFSEKFNYDHPTDFEIFNNKIILASENGLFATDKDLKTIESMLNDTLNGSTVLEIYLQDNYLYATKYKNFLYSKKLTDDKWTLVNDDNLYYNINITALNIHKDNIYFVNEYKNLYVSNDLGKTFRRVTDNQSLSMSTILTIYIDEKDVVYLGTNNGIYYSIDYGNKWEKYSPESISQTVYSLLKIGDTLFIGTDKNGLYRTSDNGQTVQQLTLNQKHPEIQINDIKYIDNNLYLGTKIYSDSFKGITVNGEGIFFSSDMGNTWEKRNQGLPDSLEIVSIAEYGDYIFVGTTWYGAIFYSSDQGQSWLPLNKGYAGYSLYKLSIYEGILYAASSAGIYSLNLKNWITGVDKLEKRNYFYSYDVYPNPAKEKVTANIYWDKTLDINNAEVGIYDIYGNKIESQENIEIIQESDWTGKLVWNCSGIPAGTYFIRIQYGTQDRVIKLLRTE